MKMNINRKLLAALFNFPSCDKEPEQPSLPLRPNHGQNQNQNNQDNQDNQDNGEEDDNNDNNDNNGDNTGNNGETPTVVGLPDIKFVGTDDLRAYIGEPVDVVFEAVGELSETLEVSFASDDKSAVRGTFELATGKGAVNVTLSAEAQRSASTVSVILKDGEKEKSYGFSVEAYYLDITANDIVFSGEGGESKKLEYTVNTNLDPFAAKVTVDADWLSYTDGVLTTTADNTTGEVRTGYIIIRDEGERFDGAVVSVIQESIAVPEPENCVQFVDPAFKAAMVAIADRDGDGHVSYDEALLVKEIVAVGKGITDLAGLEHFKNVWKLDLHDNKLVNGDVIANLHNLYWLNLEGNPDMLTADVSGCTLYFEELRIDLDSKLVITAFKNQLIYESYPRDEELHLKHQNFFINHINPVDDKRETKDFSNNGKLTKIKTHTKGSGHIAFVINAFGLLDIDLEDGSFERLMNNFFTALLKHHPTDKGNWDLFDVYLSASVGENRDFTPALSFYDDIYTTVYNTKDIDIYDGKFDAGAMFILDLDLTTVNAPQGTFSIDHALFASYNINGVSVTTPTTRYYEAIVGKPILVDPGGGIVTGTYYCSYPIDELAEMFYNPIEYLIKLRERIKREGAARYYFTENPGLADLELLEG